MSEGWADVAYFSTPKQAPCNNQRAALKPEGRLVSIRTDEQKRWILRLVDVAQLLPYAAQ